MAGITYEARDLAEIAKLFRNNAEREDRTVMNSKTSNFLLICKARANTWRAAADILDSTTITPDQSDLTPQQRSKFPLPRD